METIRTPPPRSMWGRPYSQNPYPLTEYAISKFTHLSRSRGRSKVWTSGTLRARSGASSLTATPFTSTQVHPPFFSSGLIRQKSEFSTELFIHIQIFAEYGPRSSGVNCQLTLVRFLACTLGRLILDRHTIYLYAGPRPVDFDNLVLFIFSPNKARDLEGEVVKSHRSNLLRACSSASSGSTVVVHHLSLNAGYEAFLWEGL